MRVCKYCNVTLNDNEINCPLCGAHTEVASLTNEHVSGEYPIKDITKTKKKKIHNIFVAITAIIMCAFLLVSVLSSNWAYVLVALTSIVYVWLAILNNIFIKKNTCRILTSITFYTLILINAVMFHFYFNGHHEILNTAIAIVTPSILTILNVAYMLIVFISKKWYKFAFSTIILSIIEIALLIVCIFTNLSIVAPIVAAALGLATITFSFVFGKDVMIVEFKKRLYL